MPTPLLFYVRPALAGLALLATTSAFAGCAAPAGDDGATGDDSALTRTANDHWFYAGPLPTLESPHVFVSLEGSTARLSGLLPDGVTLAEVPPHVKLKTEGTRTRVDAVYPIATARAGKSNARPGDYRMNNVIPYRPDGIAVTVEEGEHQVPWGGFPFLRYNGGIALHGPITFADNKGTPDLTVWYLQRGEVSGGCNRMMGEHVVELAHAAGISMRHVYGRNVQVNPAKPVAVTVITDYDRYDGKFVDVDYATDANVPKPTVTRPAKIHGAENVAMFGSWVASTMPDGRDLPRDFKWEGGVSGKPYVFAEHARRGWVCSVGTDHLARLGAYVKRAGDLPVSFCAKKTCVLETLRSGGDPKVACGL